MTLALVRKELRDQRPFVALGIFLCVTEVIEFVFLGLPDQRPMSLSWSKEIASQALGILMLLVALAMAWGLLTREHDERTLEFLDGLPISRWVQFATKLGTALAVLMIYPVCLLGIVLVTHLLSRNSLDRSLHLQPLAMQLALLFIASAVVLSVGLVLSFLRRLGWLVLAALLVGYFALENRHPWVRNFSPLQLLVPEYSGLHWKWPGQLLRFQLPMLAVGLVTAGVLYSARFEDWLRWVARALSTKVAKVGMVLMAIGLLIVWGTEFNRRQAAAKAQTASREDEDEDEEEDTSRQRVEFNRPLPISAETRHYHFSYLSSAQARATPLLDRADGVFEKVQLFFRAPPGDPIVADLTGSMTNTAGTAFWNTVRMDLEPGKGPEEHAAVLGHETTHVFVQRLARANESTVSGRIWPLDEGLASYVEHRFFRPASALESQERIVAAMRIRRELNVDELVFPARLLKARGRDMVYPIGRLFVDAFIRRYGEDAPARIFIEAGRRELPPNLDGPELWNELFQANGFDVGLVADDFYGAADRLARKHRAWVDRLPRPRGAVEVKKAWIRVKATLDGPLPEGWRVVCRHRPAEDSPLDRYQPAYGSEGVFTWPQSEVSGQRIWYQLGVSQGSGPVLFEAWASAPLE